MVEKANASLRVTVVREDTWYVAQCLDVDVASQGRTEQLALKNIQEALQLYFEYKPMPGGIEKSTNGELPITVVEGKENE